MCLSGAIFTLFYVIFAMAKIQRIGHDHNAPFLLLLLLGIGMGMGIRRFKCDTKPVSVGRSLQSFYSIPLNRGLGDLGIGGLRD